MWRARCSKSTSQLSALPTSGADCGESPQAPANTKWVSRAFKTTVKCVLRHRIIIVVNTFHCQRVECLANMDRTPPSLSHPDPLSPTYAFSPSKARAHRLQAADWAYVDSWLSTHYPNGAPRFERDEDTLKILLQLAKQNESADEERAMIRTVREEALAEYEGQVGTSTANRSM